jgi:uncharacterized protein (UPF0332 family)
MRENFGTSQANQVQLFDQMRRKRRRVIYEVAGLVSKHEAEQTVEFAKGFVAQLTEIITRQKGSGI